MHIKKINDKKLSIVNLKSKVDIEFLPENFIKAELDLEKTVSIEKPGEYEYQGVSVIAEEIVKENHSARINSLILSYLNNLNALCMAQKVEIDKDFIDSVGSINVVVVSFYDKDTFRNISKKLSPEAIIIFEGKDKLTADETAELNIEFKAEVAEGVIKFNDEDFNREEDSLTKVWIIK